MLYILLKVFKLLSRILYLGLKLLPVQNKVVFISRKTRYTSIDFRLLADEIAKRYPETKVVILNHRMKSEVIHGFEIIQEMYHLATSKACVVDSYVIPVSILTHKKQLVIVQIWHALGAIKEFGHMVLGRREGSSKRMADTMMMHRNYTYVTSGSEATVPIFAKAFDINEEQVVPIGMPRVDYLLDKNQQAKNKKLIYETYPQLKDKKVILYAPTFRKRGKISPAPLVDAIDYDKYILVLKQHDHDHTRLSKHEGVIIDSKFSSIELLAVADYVVTDYSATAFEAAILEKPLFFWSYDIGKYSKNRGLAMDYEAEMPGVVSRRAYRIVEAIENQEYNIDNVRRFKQKYVSVLDGTATSKIVDLLPLS